MEKIRSGSRNAFAVCSFFSHKFDKSNFYFTVDKANQFVSSTV